MPYNVIVQGEYLVAAYSEMTEDWRQRCPALEFLREMSENKSYSSWAKAYKTVLTRYAQLGRNGMTSDLFHEADKKEGIWQFIKGDLRLFCFIDDSIVVLTNGSIKKSQKVDSQAVAEATRYKAKYLAEPRRKK